MIAACATAAVLYGWALDTSGYGNAYYAAAVRSMSQSWSNFFFGAFDPLGVSTVDKPPASLWAQVLSVKVFGFHGWALILPQVLAGVATVAVLHRAVLRWAGPVAAAIAAFAMALTPIAAAVNRDNNPDTLMVLLLVCAAYCVTRALTAERALRWLVGAGVLVGAAFTAKMMQAWVVAPALFAAYLLFGPVRLPRRLGQLTVAGVGLIASSLAWVAAVDLWPGAKPYIGGSRDGSAWDLLVGYNGLGRILGTADGAGTGAGNAGPSMGGEPGLLRMFNSQVAAQISWLLPFCALAVVAAVVARRVLASHRGGWVLWAGWLVTCAAVFSLQEGIFHPYYTIQLGPAIAALVGAGAVTMWQLYRAPGAFAWALLPVAVAGTASYAWLLVNQTSYGWLSAVIALAGALAVLALVAARFWTRTRYAVRLAAVGAVLAGVAVAAAPATWAASVPINGPGAMGGVNPTAGQNTGFGSSGGPGGGFGGQRGPGGQGGQDGGMRSRMSQNGQNPVNGQNPPQGQPAQGQPPQGQPSQGQAPGSGRAGMGGGGMSGWGMASGELSASEQEVLTYVTEHRDNAKILLATMSSSSAAPYIIATGQDVVALGGFNATDQAVTLAQLQKMTAAGELRFILTGGFAGQGADSDPRLSWIQQSCTQTSIDGLYQCG